MANAGKKIKRIAIATKFKMVEWLRSNMTQQRIDAERLGKQELAELLRKVIGDEGINRNHVESVIIDAELPLKAYYPQKANVGGRINKLIHQVEQQETMILELMDRVRDLEQRLAAMRVVSSAA